MTEADRPREFSSTEHLASEAIAAYVDGELRMTAYLRASHHIAECAECAAEVDAQQQARSALRQSGDMSMPHSLLGLLSQIPMCAPPTNGEGHVNRARSRKTIITSVVNVTRRKR